MMKFPDASSTEQNKLQTTQIPFQPAKHTKMMCAEENSKKWSWTGDTSNKIWSQMHGNSRSFAHDISSNCNRSDAYASAYDNCPSQSLQCRLGHNTEVLQSGTFRGSALDNSTPHIYCLATQIDFISADTSFLRLADTSRGRNTKLKHLVSLHDVKLCVWCVCFMSTTGIIRPYFLLWL